MKRFFFQPLSLILVFAMLLSLSGVAEDGIIETNDVEMGEIAINDEPFLLDNDISPEEAGDMLLLDELHLDGIEGEVSASEGTDASTETVAPDAEESSIAGTNASKDIPKELTLGVKMTYSLDTAKLAKGKKVIYKSSNVKVVTVSKKGVITAMKKGAATITCYVGKKKIATCKVTVLPAPSNVKLPWKTLNIGKQESVQLVPIIKDGTMASFTYTTKDKKIATVSAKGVVKGLKVGKKTTITVTTQNKKKVNLTVNVMNAPEKVTLDQKMATITVSDSLQLKATLPKETASQLTWKSGNKKVVTVDENGLVTAVSAGTTKITVSTFNKKKATCTVTVAPQVTNIAIDENNFPDETFRTYVKGFDTDGDKQLSDEEIAAVTDIAVCFASTASLKGIEFFTALTQLDCDHTNLTELDLSHNAALVELRCHDAKLTSLDLSKNKNLKKLYCGNVEPERTNQLTMLDLSHNSKLTYLHCTDTQLISLNVSGCAALGGIKCYGNQLTTLNVKGCTSLEALEGQGNNLTTLDVSDSPALVACLTNGKKETFDGWVSYTSEEYCLDVDADVVLTPAPVVVTGIPINERNFPDANFRAWVLANCDSDEDGELSSAEIAAVTSINVEDMGIVSLAGIEFFADLKSLNCHNNNTMKALDLSHNTKMEELECSSTGITSLDIGNNTNLKRLDCSHTLLSSLNVRSNVALERLECYDCQLTALDLAQNNQLKGMWCMNVEGAYGNRFTELDLSHNTNLEELWCYSVGLSALDISHNSALKELNCSDNNLTTLTLGENSLLKNLNCAWNNLSVLDVSKCQKLADCITKGTKSVVSGHVSNPDYVSYTYDGYLSVDPDVKLTPTPVIVSGNAINESNFPDE